MISNDIIKEKNAKINNDKKGQLIFVDALFFKQPEMLIIEFENDYLKIVKRILFVFILWIY